MKKPEAITLHIEWSPGWVRALNVAANQRAEAATIKELGGILTGQKQAIIGIARGHFFVKTAPLPKAASGDLRQLIGVMLPQLFPLPADQLSYDYVQPGQHLGDGYLTLIGAMRSSDLRVLNAQLKEVGITPVRIVPISLSSGAVAAHAGMADALLVETSSHGTSLDVVVGGILRFSRTVQSGSDLETESQRTLTAAHTGSLPLLSLGSEDSLSGSTTHGSTLRLLEQSPPFNFELAEDRILAARKQIASRTRLGAMLLLAAVLLIVVVWLDRSQAAHAAQVSDAAYTRKLARYKSERDDAMASAAAVQAVDDQLTVAFQPGQPVSDMTRVVGDSLTNQAWLTGLTVQRGKSLDVRGTAKTAGDVASIMDSLSSSSRFRNVKLVFANSAVIGLVPVVQFDVSSDGVGNLAMPAPEKETPGSTQTTSSAQSTGDAG